MYVLFSDDRDTLHRIVRAIPRGERLHATEDWGDFVVRAPLGACRVVAPRAPLVWHSMTALSAAVVATLRPLVLVAAPTRELVSHLRQLDPADVLQPSDIEHALWTAMRRATCGTTLHRVARCLSSTNALPALMREALAIACTSERPITTVAELGACVGRDRRTMWRLWRQAMTGRDVPRLEDVLRWLLLLRAALRKDRYITWHAVASMMHVHEHTLARSAQTLLGTTLSCLTLQGTQPVTARFLERVLIPVAGAEAWDNLG